MKSMKKHWIILLLFLLISISLLTLAAFKFSFWEDETYTAAQAHKDPELLLQDAPLDIHPVLPNFIFAAWGSVFGFTELGLRSLSILASLITLFLTYFFALELFDRQTALVSVAVLGLMPLFVMFGHNARYYPLSAAFSLAVVLSLGKFFSTRKTIHLVLYVTFCVILIYISFTAASVIAACNLWWLFQWIKTKERKFADAGIWILAQISILILYFPGFRQLMTLIGQYYGEPEVNNLILEPLKRLVYLLFTYAVGQTMSPMNPLAWLGCLLTTGIILSGLITKQRKSQAWILVLILVVVISINILISLLSPWLSQIWQNLPHWSFNALPFLAILLAAGLVSLKPSWRSAAGLVLFAVYISAGYNYFTGRQYLQPMYAVPWREIFGKIAGNAVPDTGIICRGSDVACKYYAGRFGFQRNILSSSQVSAGSNAQVWWIQTNLGQARSDTAADLATREKLAQFFPAREIYNYARQDDSIRWLKNTYLGQDDYEYRVEVHRFFTP